MTLPIDVRSACTRRVVVHFISFQSAGTGCEIELSHMGKKQQKTRSGMREYLLTNLAVKIYFLVLKSLTLAHSLAK